MKKMLIAIGAVVVLLVGVVLVFIQPTFAGARTGPEVKVDPKALEATVRTLSVDFHPRDHTNVANLDRAAEWIKAQLGDGATVQEWQVNGRTYRNVSLILGPASAERVVVGAHYDACEPKPAADDNGSGVAALLELARLLKQHPPKGQVELVAWSLEEPPHFRTVSMGSYVHAKSLADAKVKVRGALSLETMGYYRDEEGSQHFPVGVLGLLYSTKGNYLAVVGNLGQIGLTRAVKSAMQSASPLPIFSINAPVAIPGIDFSDHLNYWKFGYPAVMLTDTAMNRNPNYHQPTDTYDTLDYPRLAQATSGVFEAIWRLAKP